MYNRRDNGANLDLPEVIDQILIQLPGSLGDHMRALFNARAVNRTWKDTANKLINTEIDRMHKQSASSMEFIIAIAEAGCLPFLYFNPETFKKYQGDIQIIKLILEKSDESISKEEEKFIERIRPHLQCADLNGIKLKMHYDTLRGANLKFANLTNADLRYGYLEGVDFTNANLTNADLTNVNLGNTLINMEALQSASSIMGITLYKDTLKNNFSDDEIETLQKKMVDNYKNHFNKIVNIQELTNFLTKISDPSKWRSSLLNFQCGFFAKENYGYTDSYNEVMKAGITKLAKLIQDHPEKLDLDIHYGRRSCIGMDLENLRYTMKTCEEYQDTGFFSSLFSTPKSFATSEALGAAIINNTNKPLKRI